MNAQPQVRRVGDDFLVWSAYSDEVKVDLTSCATRIADGWVVIDPIASDAASFQEALDGAPLTAIVLTNGNHQRDSLEYRERHSAAIFAHRGAQGEVDADEWLNGDEILWAQWHVCPLPGFAPGEIALRSDNDPGTLILGDAVINLPSHLFVPLPAKYCTDYQQALRSLAALGFRGTRCFFAHGEPILSLKNEFDQFRS